VFWKWFKKSESLEAQCIQTMQKLNVKDGDVLMINCPMHLSQEAIQNIRDALQETVKSFGYGVHVLILEGITVEKKWK
jgi:diketogulonate reductase-like aldo/keto reductase